MPADPRCQRASARGFAGRSWNELAAGRPRRRRALRRVYPPAVGVMLVVAGSVVLSVAGCGSAAGPARSHGGTTVTAGGRQDQTGSRHAHSPARARSASPREFAVGITEVTFVDHTRSVPLPDGERAARKIVTLVRYPAQGQATHRDAREAPPARAEGPFPLVVFGHGFAVTPMLYGRLLDAWTRAGYVVAAPVFPLENAHAPAGPNEADLPNQPADMRVVIARMEAADRTKSSLFSGLIAPLEIAVTGQSDGGDTALAVAYDHRYRDPRVRAAMILSGAEIPGLGAFQIGPGGPPLLAVQGTADTVNPPSATDAFYDGAPAPKYRLNLLGAGHLPPYSSQEPQLKVIEKTTIAFLDRYLKHVTGAQQRLQRVGSVPGIATLQADP